jgi:hypothetical protein
MLMWMSAGCTQSAGRIHTAEDWPSARTQLGRTILIVNDNHPPLLKENVRRFNESAEQALRDLPSLELVDSKPVRDRLTQKTEELMQPVGDLEAIEAARLEEIDTVCLLTVDDYRYTFGVGVGLIGVLVRAAGEIDYSIRVLDVSSGRLLLESRRACIVSGRTLPDFQGRAPQVFGVDLATVLHSCDPCHTIQQAADVTPAPGEASAMALNEK